jgi:hypothetical protein
MAVKKILSLDEIIEVDDRKIDTVDVPEWGGTVKIRALSRRQVLEALEQATARDGSVDGAKLQMLYLVRGMHEPQVTEDRIDQLNAKHPDPIHRIVERIREISGMGDDADQAADARFPGGS